MWPGRKRPGLFFRFTEVLRKKENRNPNSPSLDEYHKRPLVIQDTIQTQTMWSDPVAWIEQQLSVELYSLQIDIVEKLADRTKEGFNILGARGSGKTKGLAFALAESLSNNPGNQVICSAPIEKQSGRILRYIKGAMFSDTSKVKGLVDWQASSAFRIQWKNGSSIVAVSGQEKANAEGEHGNILVVDEAHLVPSYSISNKLMPMLSVMNGYSKVIKLGVSIGKGHFFKSVHAPSAINCTCRWDEAEKFLDEANPLFYKGKQYSRHLVAMMPVPYKVRMFPDRPDLQVVTGYEITELSWQTQYELEWVDDIKDLLGPEDQQELADGVHLPLRKGMTTERYFAGLDTAPGSLTGRSDTDRTVLCIWRLRKDRTIERVASFQWVGRILDQEEEIWQICNPKNGMFKCEIILADYSNFATEMIERFRKMRMPIFGVAFGASAKKVNSPKNWKNVMFDNFVVNLQSGLVKYPNIEKMKLKAVGASEEERTQIDNMLEGFFEWGCIQRIRGRGLNDKIEAPTDEVEDDEDGGVSKVVHDDHCSADVLAVYAATHEVLMKKEMASKGGMVGYEIPMVVIGQSYAGQAVGGGALGASFPFQGRGENPIASGEERRRGSLPGEGPDVGTSISDYIGINMGNRKS